MNINKILTQISFDDLMGLFNTSGSHIERNNPVIAAVLKSITGKDSTDIGHNLFLYFIQKLYKKEDIKNLRYMFFNDNIFEYLYDENLLNEETLQKYYKYFSKITPELNSYFLYVITNDTADKEYLYTKNKTFISDLYKYNESKVATDKKFVLDYIHYTKIVPVQLDILTQIYPDIVQTNIKQITDKQFVIDFYTNLIQFNDEAITSVFANKYYMFLLSGILSKDILTVLTSKKAFFKFSEFVQRKFREYLNDF